jgi:mono/diheme cytochrome c family protein
LLAVGCNLPGQPNPADKFKRPEEIKDFGKLFEQNCAGCHGADGKLGPAPPLNDPVFLAIVPDEVLRQTITKGRPGTPMPAFARTHGGTLTEDQVEILAAGLKLKWQDPAKKIDAASYPPYLLPAGIAGQPEDGAKLFAVACATCHGDKGQGGKRDDQPVGAINDWAFLSLCSDQVLRRYIITGRPDLGMPDCKDMNWRKYPDFKPLTNNDVTALTNLLIEWREQGAKGR